MLNLIVSPAAYVCQIFNCSVAVYLPPPTLITHRRPHLNPPPVKGRTVDGCSPPSAGGDVRGGVIVKSQ